MFPNLAGLTINGDQFCVRCDDVGETRQEFLTLFPGMTLKEGLTDELDFLHPRDLECVICTYFLNFPAGGFSTPEDKQELVDEQTAFYNNSEDGQDAARPEFYRKGLEAANLIRKSNPRRTQIEWLNPGCLHQFHRQCLSTWCNSSQAFERRNTCPTCGTQIDASIFDSLTAQGSSGTVRQREEEDSLTAQGSSGTVRQRQEEEDDFGVEDEDDPEQDIYWDLRTWPRPPAPPAPPGPPTLSRQMGSSRFDDYTSNIENGLRALENYDLRPPRLGSHRRFADLLRWEVTQMRPFFDSYALLQAFPSPRSPNFMACEEAITRFYILYRCVGRFIMEEEGATFVTDEHRRLFEVRALLFSFVNSLIQKRSEWYKLRILVNIIHSGGTLTDIREHHILVKNVPNRRYVIFGSNRPNRLLRAYNLLDNMRTLVPPWTDIKADMLTWITLLVQAYYESDIRRNNMYAEALRNQINSGLFQLFLGGRRNELPPDQAIYYDLMNQFADEFAGES